MMVGVQALVSRELGDADSASQPTRRLRLVSMRVLGIWALALLAYRAHAWYLPGSAPVSYTNGQSVPVHVNALHPMAGATPVHGLVSYDYYDERLGFCRPDAGIKACLLYTSPSPRD